jgi:hypothetical protein
MLNLSTRYFFLARPFYFGMDQSGLMRELGTLIKKGDWTVKHPRIPDLKAAREEEDEDEEVGEEEEAHDDEDTDGGGVEEKGTGRGWWSPSLDPIPEEI